MKKAKKILLVILLILFAIFYFFNPFGYSKYYPDERAIINTIEINAPAEEVFAYLGNSANAAKWSVFVDHISPLNPQEVSDGQVGSKRRCFQNPDEKGLRWDETILINEQNKRRRISIYNLIDFSIEADGLATEQLYESLENGRTRLIFSVFYLEKPDAITTFKTFIGSWYIQYIFKKNMENIKTEVEAQAKKP